MGAKRIDKNWRKEARGSNGRPRQSSTLKLEVTRSEDLPELMDVKDAATFLKCHYKTVERYRRDGAIKFLKLKTRYYTTPEWLAEFIEVESAK